MINDETNDDYEPVPLKKRFQLHTDDKNLTIRSR